MVTRAQLVATGLPVHVIEHRLRAGHLVALHRGVYRATSLPSRLEAEMAAVLACGDTAVLSHGTSASHQSLVRPSLRNGATRVEITVRGAYRSRGGDIRVHRVSRLDPDEITTFEGIPITIPARTILDIAARARPREIEQAVAHAEREGLATLADIARLLDRYPRRPGTPALRAILAVAGGPAFVRSEGEGRLLDLVRRAGLPPPRVNAIVTGLEADFIWEDRKLIVEVDGYAYHSSRRAFERDHQRDAILQDAGYRVVRVTWRQIVDEPEKVLTRIVRALGHVRSGRGHVRPGRGRRMQPSPTGLAARTASLLDARRETRPPARLGCTHREAPPTRVENPGHEAGLAATIPAERDARSRTGNPTTRRHPPRGPTAHPIPPPTRCPQPTRRPAMRPPARCPPPTRSHRPHNPPARATPLRSTRPHTRARAARPTAPDHT